MYNSSDLEFSFEENDQDEFWDIAKDYEPQLFDVDDIMELSNAKLRKELESVENKLKKEKRPGKRTLLEHEKGTLKSKMENRHEFDMRFTNFLSEKEEDALNQAEYWLDIKKTWTLDDCENLMGYFKEVEFPWEFYMDLKKGASTKDLQECLQDEKNRELLAKAMIVQRARLVNAEYIDSKKEEIKKIEDDLAKNVIVGKQDLLNKRENLRCAKIQRQMAIRLYDQVTKKLRELKASNKLAFYEKKQKEAKYDDPKINLYVDLMANEVAMRDREKSVNYLEFKLLKNKLEGTPLNARALEDRDLYNRDMKKIEKENKLLMKKLNSITEVNKAMENKKGLVLGK